MGYVKLYMISLYVFFQNGAGVFPRCPSIYSPSSHNF